MTGGRLTSQNQQVRRDVRAPKVTPAEFDAVAARVAAIETLVRPADTMLNSNASAQNTAGEWIAGTNLRPGIWSVTVAGVTNAATSVTALSVNGRRIVVGTIGAIVNAPLAVTLIVTVRNDRRITVAQRAASASDNFNAHSVSAHRVSHGST